MAGEAFFVALEKLFMKAFSNSLNLVRIALRM